MYVMVQLARGDNAADDLRLAAMAARIDLAAHAKYFLRCLELLPAPYASLDTNRLTVAYFCVSGLDVLGCLERVDAPRIISWIYSLQVRVRVRVRVRVSAVRTDAALRVLVIRPDDGLGSSSRGSTRFRCCHRPTAPRARRRGVAQDSAAGRSWVGPTAPAALPRAASTTRGTSR